MAINKGCLGGIVEYNEVRNISFKVEILQDKPMSSYNKLIRDKIPEILDKK